MTTEQSALPDSETAHRAARGAAAYVMRTGASQVIQAVGALVVARILLPREYGVFALILTLIGCVRMCGDLGITFSLVVQRHVNESDLRVGCTVALLVAIVGGAIVSVVWWHLALVHSVGQSAVWIAPVMASTLIIAVPAFPSTVMIERNLGFSRLGVIGVVQVAALFATQVGLLLAGVGLWSMVIAQVVGAVVGTVLTVRASGRFYRPTLKGPIARLVKDGLPYQGGLVAISVAALATNLIVAAELGARGIGLFAWCTILAMPVTGALAAVHNVSTPTLAKMRRDDGSRYDESVRVAMQTLVAIAAVAAGCLIGIASPTIRFVFGERWLPATTAVQFCLAGTMPTAILSVLASDANARMMRRATMTAWLAAGVATLAVLLPLMSVAGVGGASAASWCVGPVVACAVFAWALDVDVGPCVWHAARLFVPLLGLSIVLRNLATTPVSFAVVCVLITVAAAVAIYACERSLATRIFRLIRRPLAPLGRDAGSTAAVVYEAPGGVTT